MPSITVLFGEMDDKLGHEQVMAFGNSLRRMAEIFETTPVSIEASAMAAEVVKVARGFRIMGGAYADQLVKKAGEVKALQKEKQMLENKVEQLASVVSGMVSGKTTVIKNASNVDLPTTTKPEEQVKNQGNLKNGHLQVNLHLKCEEELVNRELELAKLREAYTARTFDRREYRKEVLQLETRLKDAENQAASKEKERLDLLKTHTDEITNLKNDIVRLKEETTQMGKESGRLGEQLGRATLKNEQFVELLKKDSKHQDELRRQQKTLKGYLQLLAAKFTSTQESEDLQFELRGLECRGLDEDTTSYLKIILEKGFKPAKCSVGTQTMSNNVAQSSSSTQTRYSADTEGTQKLSGNPSAMHPFAPPSAEDTDVLDDQWDLNFAPDVGEVKAPQNLDEEYREVIRSPYSTEEPSQEHVPEKWLDHAGVKRPTEVIDLGSDTEDDKEEPHTIFRHKYRRLSPALERVGNALDINIPLCELLLTEVPLGRKKGLGRLPTREEVAPRKVFGGSYF